jgi:amidase
MPEHAPGRRQLLKMIAAAALAPLPSGFIARRAAAAQATAPEAEALHYRSLTDVAKLVASRRVSPVELTEHMLARISVLDADLHSYFTVSADRALEDARRAESEIRAGRYRGPLHGVPVAVKDLCLTKDMITTGGLSFLRDFVPDEDSTVVARLEAAGAVLLGKLAMTEGAMAGYHRDFAIPVNPWVPGRWTGGSSSGSGVATAAGLCFGSLGSDTGGSIRFPAAANALVGLKPTYGRVSRHGVMPLAESMDHVGPMTRTVADAAAVLQAIAGHDPRDPSSLEAPVPDYAAALGQSIRGLRIGFDQAQLDAAGNAGYVDSLELALEQLRGLGAETVRLTAIPVPGPPGQLWFTLAAYEAHQAHKKHFPTMAGAYGAYFRDFLEQGAAIDVATYESAREAARDFARAYRAQLESVDVVAGPAAGPAFPVTEEILYGGAAGFDSLIHLLGLQFTLPANLAGVPTICLPCGFSSGNVPFSLQFTARWLGEGSILQVAAAYEAATAWHLRHPVA